MNILNMLLANKDTIGALARNFGVQEGQMQGALGQLLPAVARGLQNNASSQPGLESLLGALTKGSHQRYLDPDVVTNRATTDDGNAILGHIFGNKDMSRAVADRAADSTGLGAGMLKKMLPVIAAIAMGALNKQAAGANMIGANAASATPHAQFGGLSSFLDVDKDGSIADDLLGIATKLLQGAT